MAPILFLADEKEVVYEVVPSLQYISAVKIAATLWNRVDVRDLIQENDVDWNWAKEKVRRYVQVLLLSEPTKVIVLNFAEIIGDEINEWLVCYGNSILPKELYWTVFGFLDTRKTALSLVSDPDADLCYRYELACMFCLEKYVIEIWNQLPNRYKEKYCTQNKAKALVTMWSDAMKTGVTLESSFEKFWAPADFLGNDIDLTRKYCKAAVEYFLPKLSGPTRKIFLENLFDSCLSGIKTFPDIASTWIIELIFFLLSQMCESQQTSCLEHISHLLLLCCLIWPRQTVFMPVAKLLEPFLSDSLCMYVFDQIIQKVSDGAVGYNYQQLFTEFWEQSPETRKSFVMQKLASGWDLLFKLFAVGDRENIRLILLDATAEEREKIASYYRENSHDLELYGTDTLRSEWWENAELWWCSIL